MGASERTVSDDWKNALGVHRRAIDAAGLDAVFEGRFAVAMED